MKYWSIIIWCSCLSLLTYAQSKPELSKNSKQYNGLYIFNDQVNKLFPSANVTYSKASVHKLISDIKIAKTDYKKYCIFLIGGSLMPSTNDMVAIKSFIAEGNTVFVAGNDYDSKWYNYFDITINQYNNTNNAISLTQPNTELTDTLQSRAIKNYTAYFNNYNIQKGIVLGKNADSTINFLKYNYGSGGIYFHTYPQIFMNYFLVERNNYSYTESALSYVPQYTSNIIVVTPRNSANYNGNQEPPPDMLSLIKNNSNLLSASLLTITLFALLLLFGFKRKQRNIPIVQPLQNNTMDYAKTIGDLYFNQKSNIDIAEKKLQFWQDTVRTKYQLPTHTMEKDFWEALAKKTGKTPALLKGLEQSIIRIRTKHVLSDAELLQWNNQINQFNA